MSDEGTAEGVTLAAFCRREYPRLVGALSLYCGDADVAEELAQEALTRAADRWPRVGQMDAPGAWVHRVGMNLCGSWFRRKRAERRANARVGAEPAAPGRDLAGEIAVREQLTRLPPRQRRVVVLRYYLDLPVEDAADVLVISPSAVASLTHRAITRMRGQSLPAGVEAPDV